MTLLILCAGLALLVGIPKPYSFTVYQGPSSRTYTNTWLVGWPPSDSTGTNFSATNNVPPGSNFFAVTVTSRSSGFESDYSNEIGVSGLTNVVLYWSWAVTNPPTTNIVQISAGTNSLTFTNPASLWAFYRLRGLSWTQSEVLAANYANWQWSWLRIATWSYPSNTVPLLSIKRL